MKIIDKVSENIVNELLRDEELQQEIIIEGLKRYSIYPSEIRMEDHIDIVFKDPIKLFPEFFELVTKVENPYRTLEKWDKENFVYNVAGKIVNFMNENLLSFVKVDCGKEFLIVSIPEEFLKLREQEDIVNSIRHLLLEDYYLKNKLFEIILEYEIEQVCEVFNLRTFISEVSKFSLYNIIYRNIEESGLIHDLMIIKNMFQVIEQYLILRLKGEINESHRISNR